MFLHFDFFKGENKNPLQVSFSLAKTGTNAGEVKGKCHRQTFEDWGITCIA